MLGRVNVGGFNGAKIVEGTVVNNAILMLYDGSKESSKQFHGDTFVQSNNGIVTRESNYISVTHAPLPPGEEDDVDYAFTFRKSNNGCFPITHKCKMVTLDEAYFVFCEYLEDEYNASEESVEMDEDDTTIHTAVFDNSGVDYIVPIYFKFDTNSIYSDSVRIASFSIEVDGIKTNESLKNGDILHINLQEELDVSGGLIVNNVAYNINASSLKVGSYYFMYDSTNGLTSITAKGAPIEVIPVNNYLNPTLATITSYGITVTKNARKSYTISGANTSSNAVQYTLQSNISLEADEYQLVAWNTDVSTKAVLKLTNGTDEYIVNTATPTKVSLSENGTYSLVLVILGNADFSTSITCRDMLTKYKGDDLSYDDYAYIGGEIVIKYPNRFKAGQLVHFYSNTAGKIYVNDSVSNWDGIEGDNYCYANGPNTLRLAFFGGNAVASDILSGKTACVNGKVLSGTYVAPKTVTTIVENTGKRTGTNKWTSVTSGSLSASGSRTINRSFSFSGNASDVLAEVEILFEGSTYRRTIICYCYNGSFVTSADSNGYQYINSASITKTNSSTCQFSFTIKNNQTVAWTAYLIHEKYYDVSKANKVILANPSYYATDVTIPSVNVQNSITLNGATATDSSQYATFNCATFLVNSTTIRTLAQNDSNSKGVMAVIEL